MLSRRELCVAMAALAAGGKAFALADEPGALGSTVFDWDKMTAKPTETGSVRSVCKAKTATLEELEIHVTTLDPGKSPHLPHRHPNEELVILRQGTLEAFENGAWTRVRAGSVIFSASNQLHGLRNAGSEPAIYHVINWRSTATPEAARG